MNKYQKIVAEIIDHAEDAIRQSNPDIEAIASKKKGNTLLYGEAYYDLEDYMAEILRERLRDR